MAAHCGNLAGKILSAVGPVSRGGSKSRLLPLQSGSQETCMTCCSRPSSMADVIPVARSLRREFEATAAALDATGEYPTRNMERIVETGLDAICFPREWGGVANKSPHEDLEAVAEIFTELSAGESSTAQIFMVHRNLVLGLLSGTGVSEE